MQITLSDKISFLKVIVQRFQILAQLPENTDGAFFFWGLDCETPVNCKLIRMSLCSWGRKVHLGFFLGKLTHIIFLTLKFG